MTAAIPPADVEDRLRRSARFYTQGAEQHQALFAVVPQTFSGSSTFAGWILNVPEASCAWCRLSVFTVWNPLATAVRLDGNTLTQKRRTREPELVTVRLSQLNGGEHTLSGRAVSLGRSGKGSILIEAYFAQPSSRMALYDKLGVLLTTRAPYSRKLTALELPACRAYPARR